MRHGNDVPHLLLLLCLGNLLQEGSLLIRRMPGQHPPLRFVAHLPGPGRDRFGRRCHRVVGRIEVRDHVVPVCLCRTPHRLGNRLFDDGLLPLLNRPALLPVLPVSGNGRHQRNEQLENLDQLVIDHAKRPPFRGERGGLQGKEGSGNGCSPPPLDLFQPAVHFGDRPEDGKKHHQAPDAHAEDVPEPLDSRVSIREVPSRELAVIRFRGRAQDRDVSSVRERLFAALREAGIPTVGTPFLMRYNSPFTPGFLRRNEVGVEVRREGL